MATRGVRAEELLDNELFSEAFTVLEASYISAWRASAIDNSAGREKLLLAITSSARCAIISPQLPLTASWHRRN
jgi:hypothetical protein